MDDEGRTSQLIANLTKLASDCPDLIELEPLLGEFNTDLSPSLIPLLR